MNAAYERYLRGALQEYLLAGLAKGVQEDGLASFLDWVADGGPTRSEPSVYGYAEALGEHLVSTVDEWTLTFELGLARPSDAAAAVAACDADIDTLLDEWADTLAAMSDYDHASALAESLETTGTSLRDVQRAAKAQATVVAATGFRRDQAVVGTVMGDPFPFFATGARREDTGLWVVRMHTWGPTRPMGGDPLVEFYRDGVLVADHYLDALAKDMDSPFVVTADSPGSRGLRLQPYDRRALVEACLDRCREWERERELVGPGTDQIGI